MATATGGFSASATINAEHDHRCCDTGFDEVERHARHAEQAARGHDGQEGRRNEPQRAAADLVGEDTDRHHRQDVVEAGHRVQEAMDELAVFAAVAGVGESGRRSEGHGSEGQSRQKFAHGRFLIVR